MKKHIGLGTLGIFLGCLMTLTAFGQDRALKRVKKKTENGLIEYHVLKSEKDVMHGPFEETEFSRVVQKGSYFEGKKDGEWLYYDLGKLDRSILYDKGKEISNSVYLVDFKKTYENSKVGTVAYSEVYNGDTVATGFYAKNEKNGKWAYYMPWGKMAESNYINGKKEGKETFWYKGELKSERMYENGRLNGPLKSYWTDLKIKDQYSYKDGEKEGEFSSHYSNGQLGLKGQFKYDELDGEVRGYYENGEKRMEMTMVEGVAHGPFTVYFDDGKLMLAGTFEYGKLMTINGAADANGDEESPLLFNDGTGTVTIYGLGTTKLMKLNLRNGQFHGKQVAYQSSDKKLRETEFKDGVAHGAHKEYNSEGTIVVEGPCKGGFKDGTWTYKYSGRSTTQEYSAEDSMALEGYLWGDYAKALFPTDQGISDYWTATFTVIQDMPQFYGGQEAMVRYLRRYIKYPELERNNDIQGVSYVQFVVSALGEIQNVKIYPGTEGKATENMHREALQVVKQMPRWEPGFQNGTAVNVSYSLPIRFKLR